RVLRCRVLQDFAATCFETSLQGASLQGASRLRCNVLRDLATGCFQTAPQRASSLRLQGAGTRRACADLMGVRDFRDLVCWQLSYELKCEVFAFTAIGPASRDFKYRDQIRDSSAAAPRNITEGFGRYRPREFARFLEFARASLMETQSSLIDGRDNG